MNCHKDTMRDCDQSLAVQLDTESRCTEEAQNPKNQCSQQTPRCWEKDPARQIMPQQKMMETMTGIVLPQVGSNDNILRFSVHRLTNLHRLDIEDNSCPLSSDANQGMHNNLL